VASLISFFLGIISGIFVSIGVDVFRYFYFLRNWLSA
jgi:hypothetical protein